MPFVVKPNSAGRIVYFLDTARKKFTKVKADGGTPAFSQAVFDRLIVILPILFDLVKSINVAHAEQTLSTKAKRDVLTKLKNIVSHFIQTFNNAVVREVFQAGERPYFGIDANDGTVPQLTKEEDIVSLAVKIISGEASRASAGLAPVLLPSASDIQTLYNQWVTLDTDQSEKKDKYDNELEKVDAMRSQLDNLIDDIYDEVQYTFRKESAPSKRKNCREYGILFATRKDEQSEDTADIPEEGLNGEAIEVL